MFEKVMEFFKKIAKKDKNIVAANSKEQAKERLHLVLMQDRANVSADFLELMKQEIIDVIKKYIDIDESAIDVRLTNKENEDGTNGAPALYANIPIKNIKNETRKIDSKENAKTAKEKEETKEKDKDKDLGNEEKNSEEDKNKVENKINNESKEVEETIIDNGSEKKAKTSKKQEENTKKKTKKENTTDEEKNEENKETSEIVIDSNKE